MSDAPSVVGVSIVIPTFARPERLRECLEAVTLLDGDHDFEVIVADDGSVDSTHAVVASFQQQLDVRVVALRRGGPGAARNAGAALARGRYLAFLDDDCRPAPGWLVALKRELARQGGLPLVGGRVENALLDNPYSDASERITRFVSDYNRGGLAREPFLPTNNLAVSAELFGEVGGFSSNIPSQTAEDKEFCDRWRARGHEIVHVPDAIVYHAHNLTLWQFLRQHFNYGRGILAFRQLRRQRAAESRLLPERLSFYMQLLLSPLRAKPVRRHWRPFLLVTLAQAATGFGAARESLGTARAHQRSRSRASERRP